MRTDPIRFETRSQQRRIRESSVSFAQTNKKTKKIGKKKHPLRNLRLCLLRRIPPPPPNGCSPDLGSWKPTIPWHLTSRTNPLHQSPNFKLSKILLRSRFLNPRLPPWSRDGGTVTRCIHVTRTFSIARFVAIITIEWKREKRVCSVAISVGRTRVPTVVVFSTSLLNYYSSYL